MKNFTFKKLFWSYTFCMVPFALLSAFLALFNVVPVVFNGRDTFGVVGFIVPIAFIPFFGLLFSGFNWLALNFGHWLYISFCKMLKIKTE